MALRFDAAGESLSRTANLPSFAAFSILGWLFLAVNRATWTAFFSYTGGTYGFFLGQSDAAGIYYTVHDPNGTPTTGSQLSLSTWYHIGLVVEGTGAGQLKAYLNGAADITTASLGGTGTQIQLGDDSWGGGADFLNGRLAAVKIYNAALTATDVDRERWSYVPQRLSNLHAWLPLVHPTVATNGLDWSGNGYNYTVNGTLAVEDGPPIAWGPARMPMSRGGAVAVPALAPPPFQRPWRVTRRRRIA